MFTASAAEPPAADPKAAAEDPDFLVQGEYAGDQKGIQVIAMGDGEFDVVVYEGGLPGAGANSDEPRRLEADADVVADLVESMELRRVERKSFTLGAKPPAGAVVLFDGTQNSVDEHWENGRLSDNGLLMQGTTSKDVFDDYTLHLEFRTPWMPDKRGQGRGNSGLYHQGRYETQILDSFGLKGRMNETGGIYSVRDPDLNMCFPPLSWQTYDVEFTAARYDGTGKKTRNARMTVRLNGVVVQNDTEVPKTTTAAKLREEPKPGPIYLQDHGAPVRFRNIWVLPRDADREARRPIIPGFERFYAGASEPSPQAGELLISSLACDACHAAAGSPSLPQKRGPDLSEVAARVRADALVAMIADPHGVKPGTTMPDVWHDLDGPQRHERAAAIASYLVMASGGGELRDRAMSNEIANQGKNLYHSIGCVACHAAFEGNATPPSTTVPMGDVSRKYTVASLARFLREPHKVRPGLRMPALTGTAAEAVAIATYLTREVTVRETKGRFQRRVYRGKWDKLPDFDQLQPVASDTVVGLKFRDIQPNNDFGVVFEAELPIHTSGEYHFALSSDDGSRFEIAGNRLDNDGVHGNQTREATFNLQAGVHPIRIELFNAGGGVELALKMGDPEFGSVDIAGLILDPENPVPKDLMPSKFQPQRSLVDQGRAWFASSGCANCHAVEPPLTSTVNAPPLDHLRDGHGCLATEVQSPAVDFELNPAQRAAITAALVHRKSGSPGFDDAERVHLTMAALNCYACHRRGGLGGAESTRDAHFQTAIPEMGLEGRLPPPLDGVGDKLRDEYFVRILDNGDNLRSYMRTRMPGYRHQSLKPFHESIRRLDRKDEMPTVNHTQPHDDVVASGRRIVGNRGLACIKCHAYGGEKGGGIGAIDMLQMNQRVRVEWFHRYLRNPSLYRPATRMPNSFPDGVSALKDLYNGDPALQIDAMWQYLVAGKEAKEPEGLKPGAIVLVARERPTIYRNFFQDVSGRGIGVGYPVDVNLIWDAERMSLAQIWKNSFMDAAMHWRGRGQGRQQPLGDAIVKLESSTPFARLSSIDDPWPGESGRDQGFRFRGYRLDQAGDPAFRFSIDETHIEDAPKPGKQGDSVMIIRQLTIEHASSGDPLVWQPAVGQIHETEKGFRIDDRYELAIEGIECELVDRDGKQHLRALIPKGSTRIKETIRW